MLSSKYCCVQVQVSPALLYWISHEQLYTVHWRRKILKVRWAQYPVAHEARVKFLQTRPLCVKQRPFLHDRDCYREFLNEKMNCKSNGKQSRHIHSVTAN